MKKLIKIAALILGLIFVSGCFFKPQITKEQQNNVALELLGTTMFGRLSLLVLQKMRAREVIF